jgi:hypothetical protein
MAKKTFLKLECSFCGKSQKQVRKLIAGPRVYICDECIGLCNDIIGEEAAQEARQPLPRAQATLDSLAHAANDVTAGTAALTRAWARLPEEEVRAEDVVVSSLVALLTAASRAGVPMTEVAGTLSESWPRDFREQAERRHKELTAAIDRHTRELRRKHQPKRKPKKKRQPTGERSRGPEPR